MAGRGSKPGERRGGRGKGTPNKTTTAIKEMIEGALSDLGGQKWLVGAAKENPAAFMALVGRLIPRDLNVSGEVKHTLEQLIVGSFADRSDSASDRPH